MRAGFLFCYICRLILNVKTMRKHILTMLVLALTCAALQARPVDQATASRLGQSFVKANFEFTRQSTDLNLVYTAFSDRGEACYYVFNVGDTGFVIIAGDDNHRPVIGYSEEGVFNPDDMAPALAEYLEIVRQGVMEASTKPSAPSPTTHSSYISCTSSWFDAFLISTGRTSPSPLGEVGRGLKSTHSLL